MSNSTISTFELFEMFPSAESARVYFEAKRWPNGPVCPSGATVDGVSREPRAHHAGALDVDRRPTRETSSPGDRSLREPLAPVAVCEELEPLARRLPHLTRNRVARVTETKSSRSSNGGRHASRALPSSLAGSSHDD
jgi:hypothetical protein